MKRYFIIFLFLILLIGVLIFLPRQPFSETEVVFSIEKGWGSRDIAYNLEKEGLIVFSPVFRVYVLTIGVSEKLQAGKYFLSPSMNISQIASKMAQGEVIKEKITIIEGWNLRNIGFYFENKGMFQAEEIWEVAGFPAIDYAEATDLPEPKDFSSDYEFLKEKPANVGLEGYLFPDTYEINQGIEAAEIIWKMLNNFDEKLTTDLRQEIKNQKKTIFDIITMASLIEKEVQTKEDKEIVSGIFWKRIKLGKPLESCATIAYIKGVDQWRYSFEDTRIGSPYNTYLNPGLPVGPICNPGLESIEAALYPKESQYWYYLSTPEGETIFSRTLEEHNIAKAKYLGR